MTVHRDPLTVGVCGEGRHLFEGCRDPRVRVIRSAAGADFVIFPCGRHRRFENLDEVGPPPPRARLIFDASLEGVPHKPDITAALHAHLARWGVSPRRCVYVTQERRYADDYRAHCALNGIEPVSVLVHDYWVWRSLEAFGEHGVDVYEARLKAFHSRSARRRRFLTLNRTPRPTKILLLLRLLRDDLWNCGFVSFGGFQHAPGAPGKPKPTTA